MPEAAREPAGRASTSAILYAAAAVLMAFPAGRAAAQSSPSEIARVEVLDIRFEGAEAVIPDEALRGAIMTSDSECRLPSFLPPCWIGLMQNRRFLNRQVLNQDVLRLRLFFHRRGYHEASVEARLEPDGGSGEREGAVVFHIDPGRPVIVEHLEVSGPGDLFPPAARMELPLSEGEPFNLLDYEAVRDTLRAQLLDRGYPRAAVLAGYTISNDAPYSARVRYMVHPGERARFGDVRVVGTEEVSPVIVRRMLTFETGDLYRQSDLLRSQRTIYTLGLFRHVSIEPELEAEPDSIVPITIQVNEGDTHRVRVGIGLNTIDAVNAEGRWTSRNFLGSGRRLEVSGRIANVLADRLNRVDLFGVRIFQTGQDLYADVDGSLAIDFSQPWVFGPRNSLNAGIFAERLSVPQVFVRRAVGGYASFSRQLGRAITATVGYRPELTALTAESDLFFCVNYRVCAENEIALVAEPHWLVPAVFSLTVDGVNNVFAPTDGYMLRADVEYATEPLGSDFEYLRLLGEATWYEDIVGDWVIAARLRPGWAMVTGRGAGTGLGLNPQKRFFAGGPNSVRGFAQYRLGPKVLTVNAAERLLAAGAERGAGCTVAAVNTGTCDASALAAAHADAFDIRPVGGAALIEGSIETRFPIWGETIGGAAFVDFGQVWSQASDVHLDELVWTPGLGIRYFSPIGPIRIDIAYNPVDARTLPVITSTVCGGGTGVPCSESLAALEPSVESDAVRNTTELVRLHSPVQWNPRREFLDRLQIHFSIGQAF